MQVTEMLLTCLGDLMKRLLHPVLYAVVAWQILHAISALADDTINGPSAELSGRQNRQFDAMLAIDSWQTVFKDACTANWQSQWFLDGEFAKVNNDDQAMTINTAKGYAVLWTKESFAGDLRIEYDFQRLDESQKGVNILYIQATGDGQGECTEDIRQWSHLRTQAAMSDYFQNMHTYHISYATDKDDYVRGRRYLPLANRRLAGTQLSGEIKHAGLFNDKRWIHVTVIKRDQELWVEFAHPDRTIRGHFRNSDKPSVTHGRVGLRLMPGRLSRFRNFQIMALPKGGQQETDDVATERSAIPPWKTWVGKPGASGWRCHVVQSDPDDDGPDGVNLHDWDGDGDLDAFVNTEEGHYSRLYFNPGPGQVRMPWKEYIQFEHGKCEDSGIGDLDDDGDMDYIANGGWIFFNPGTALVRERASWKMMTLFKQEQRVPTVADVNGDGLLDLIVGAHEWYQQPREGKHEPVNWKKHVIGKNRWAMNCIVADLDQDGDRDLIVPDRGVETCWYENPGQTRVHKPWTRHSLHSHTEPLFTVLADISGDGIEDLVIAGGNQGPMAKKLILLIRTNQRGAPAYQEILIEQPCGNFPKGIAVLELDGRNRSPEVVVLPKQGDLWMVSCSGDPLESSNWRASPMQIPGAESRKKMDQGVVGDIDSDGDDDLITSEENGGWGVIWFENPGTMAP